MSNLRPAGHIWTGTPCLTVGTCWLLWPGLGCGCLDYSQWFGPVASVLGGEGRGEDLDRRSKLKLAGVCVNICSKFKRLQLCCRVFRRSVGILEFSPSVRA